MQLALIDNCRFVFTLGWNALLHIHRVMDEIDDMIGSRGKLSGVVMPMSAIAALVTLLSVIVYTRDYQHAVAEMIYVFGSFLLAYILFVTVLNFFASRGWFTDEPRRFCNNAKSFVICLLVVHFDVTLITSVVPSFRIAELIEFLVIYVSWSMSGRYLPVSRYRSAFGIISGALFLLFFNMLHLVLVKSFPNMPI